MVRRTWLAAVLALILSACGGAGQDALTAQRAALTPMAAAAVPGSLSADTFFAWAESVFPIFFASGPSTSFLPPYTYRAYSSGNYLGVGNDAVWLLGPLTGGPLQQVAPLAAFDCLVQPMRCGDQAVRLPNAVLSGNYPLKYMLGGETFAGNVNVCDTAPAQIVFPARYMGSSVLPMPLGAPLAATVQRAVSMKDVWAVDNPSFEAGCQGSARSAFLLTLQRLKALNVQEVSVTPWTDVDNSQATWRIRNPAETQSSTMGDQDLAWVTARVKEAGLKLQWVNQIQTVNMTTPPAATADNINKYFDAFEPYILERGALAQQLGIDAMWIDCNCWMMNNRQLADARMATIVPKLRNVYGGKLYYTVNKDAPPALKQHIDESVFTLFTGWLPLTPAEKASPTVDMLKARLLNTFQGLTQQLELSKPLRVYISFPSRSDQFDNGYLEETFCTAGYNDLSGQNSACIQRSTPTDFSVQALLHQAALAAIKEQSTWRISGVHVEYWQTDAIVPGTTFPNLAVSVRNKPAEAIVQSWFAAP